MFHLTTHAFFKALLFLGAGSVILALHHEQDIWKMGGLRQKMPVTSGPSWPARWRWRACWPFSGFYSKDSILAPAPAEHQLRRSSPWGRRGRADSVLHVPSGLRRVPRRRQSPKPPAMRTNRRGDDLAAALSWRCSASSAASSGIEQRLRAAAFRLEQVGERLPVAAARCCLHGRAGGGCAWACWPPLWVLPPPGRSTPRRPRTRCRRSWAHSSRWMRNRFYFDELYEATVIRLHDLLAAMAGWFDRWIIAGLAVRGTHGTTELVGRALAPGANRQPANLRASCSPSACAASLLYLAC